MPDISLTAILPTAPAAPATAVAPISALPADPNAPAPNFLTQLKSAVASLASIALPRTTAPAVPSMTREPSLPSEPMPLKADDVQAPTTDDKTAETMPELLAALGFVPVPAAFQLPVTPEPPVTAAPITSSSAQLSSAAPLKAEPTVFASPLATANTPNAQSEIAQPSDAATQPAATSQPPLQASTVHAGQAAPKAPASPPMADVTPVPTVMTPIDPATTNALRTVAVSSDLPAHAADAATLPATSAAHAATPAIVAQAQPNNAFGQSAQGDADDSPDGNRSLSALDGAQLPAANANQEVSAATLANGLSQVTAPAATVPGHIQPSQVVNQIAHQADLYRLPGNKGVRIQLHPEDLGGVDVTLRYSAAGGIQLHINVEHAATGDLVQSGWTELRDALATQGINPERLLMSITAPDDASRPDFSRSAGNGSNRADQGPAGFGQGQSSGQQHSDGQPPRRTTTTWSGLSDSAPSSAETGARAGASASSRIDYRV